MVLWNTVVAARATHAQLRQLPQSASAMEARVGLLHALEAYETSIGPADVDRLLAGVSRGAAAGGSPTLRGSLRETLAGVERELIERTVEAHGWRMTEAAAALGLERSHLYKKLRALGIERPGR